MTYILIIAGLVVVGVISGAVMMLLCTKSDTDWVPTEVEQEMDEYAELREYRL